jgi:hypothetical protein
MIKRKARCESLVRQYNVSSCASPALTCPDLLWPALTVPPYVQRVGPFARPASFFVGQKMCHRCKVKQSHYTPWRCLRREEVQLLLIHDFGTRWGWVVSLTPRPNGPPVLIGQEAGWDPEPVWTQRLQEKSFAPAGDRTSIARSSRP